ncbi:claudin-16-like [Pelodytes ibericus]
MGTSSVQISSLVLAMLSFLSFIISSLTDCWKQDAKDAYSSVGLSVRCRGLWSECVYDNMASFWTCDIPVSYLSDHPVSLVITRALVIVKGLLCLIAFPLLVLGMKCTTIISTGDQQKGQFCQAAGIMLLSGGICGAVAVGWFAIDTALKYRTEVVLAVPGITYELGYSFWLAAVSATCVCISGLLLIGLNCINTGAQTKTFNSIQPRSLHNAMTYL